MKQRAKMETVICDVLCAAAAVATWQEAEQTELIHVLIGSMVQSEAHKSLLQSRRIHSPGLEKWREKIITNSYLLQSWTPGCSQEVRAILRNCIVSGQKKGCICEADLMREILHHSNQQIDRYLKTFKLSRADLSRFWDETVAQQQGRQSDQQPFSDYVENLNQKAMAGTIYPIKGREALIQKMVSILCQYRKKNVILIGDPGVGKTALAEELALRITRGTVPEKLKNRTILSLDVGSMVAGTKLRGQFEERMRNLIHYLKKHPNSVLFIDELHTIMNAGNSLVSSLNAANMLKPALSRGEITCIGATTREDVIPIEKDAAFKRRFQFLLVNELTPSETMDVLQSESERLERHYDVTYTLGGIKRIQQAAAEYFPHQFEPDRSLTLMDSVGSFVRNQMAKDTVSTQAVISYLRDGDFRDSRSVLDRLDRLVSGMFSDREVTEKLLGEISAYLMHLHQPSILVLAENQPGAAQELAETISREIHGEKALTMDGEELAGPESMPLIKGVAPPYHSEPTLLDKLRFSPHRVVFIRHFDKADPGVKDVLTTALCAGELVERSGKSVQLKHALFIISTTQGQALGFQDSQPRAVISKPIGKRATVICLPAVRAEWTKEHLIARLNQLADRVRTRLKVAFAPETITELNRMLEQGMSEDQVVQKAEEEILLAHRRADRRLVITPEMLR